jgi:hypothetical protein
MMATWASPITQLTAVSLYNGSHSSSLLVSRRHAGNEMFRPTSPEIYVVPMTADATSATTRTILIRSSHPTGGIGGRECQIVDPTTGSR